MTRRKCRKSFCSAEVWRTRIERVFWVIFAATWLVPLAVGLAVRQCGLEIKIDPIWADCKKKLQYPIRSLRRRAQWNEEDEIRSAEWMSRYRPCFVSLCALARRSLSFDSNGKTRDYRPQNKTPKRLRDWAPFQILSPVATVDELRGGRGPIGGDQTSLYGPSRPTWCAATVPSKWFIATLATQPTKKTTSITYGWRSEIPARSVAGRTLVWLLRTASNRRACYSLATAPP